MRATQERLWSRDHEDGMRLCQEGRYPEAEGKFRSAVKHARTGGIADARTAATLYQLATLSARRGHATEALAFYKQSLEVEQRALGADHPYVAMILRAYAALLARTHHAAQAAALAAQADAIWRGDSHGRHADWSSWAA